jgi:DNA repair protein SbcD/Mre11
MPRILHMADVHLGARHDDLGPAAAAQRERQFAAFQRAVELAISDKAELVLIAGDLFDSNSQPRRSVERAAAELSKLVERHVPLVIIPGTHDCYEPGSIYRVFDVPALAGARPGSDDVVVLTDERRHVTFAQLDITVHAWVAATKHITGSPLAGFSAAAAGDGAKWQVGVIHGSFASVTDRDDVVFSEQEVAASGLDYLALGHWHSFREGRAKGTVWAYSGAPEPVAVDQDGAGQVALVTLTEVNGKRQVSVEPRRVGRTVFERLELDAAEISSQQEIARRVLDRADADLVLDVRLVGVKADELDLNVDEIQQQAEGSFFRLRLRDESVAALPEGQLPPEDTIAGAFIRDLEMRIDEAQRRGEADRATELREALRIGRLLLDAPERVTLA